MKLFAGCTADTNRSDFCLFVYFVAFTTDRGAYAVCVLLLCCAAEYTAHAKESSVDVIIQDIKDMNLEELPPGGGLEAV